VATTIAVPLSDALKLPGVNVLLPTTSPCGEGMAVPRVNTIRTIFGPHTCTFSLPPFDSTQSAPSDCVEKEETHCALLRENCAAIQQDTTAALTIDLFIRTPFCFPEPDSVENPLPYLPFPGRCCTAMIISLYYH
jgi:hypothetical protein